MMHKAWCRLFFLNFTVSLLHMVQLILSVFTPAGTSCMPATKGVAPPGVSPTPVLVLHVPLPQWALSCPAVISNQCLSFPTPHVRYPVRPRRQGGPNAQCGRSISPVPSTLLLECTYVGFSAQATDDCTDSPCSCFMDISSVTCTVSATSITLKSLMFPRRAVLSAVSKSGQFFYNVFSRSCSQHASSCDGSSSLPIWAEALSMSLLRVNVDHSSQKSPSPL